MSNLKVSLKASNSSGEQLMHFTVGEGEVMISITGDYRGSEMQVDFNGLGKYELMGLIAALEVSMKQLDLSGE